MNKWGLVEQGWMDVQPNRQMDHFATDTVRDEHTHSDTYRPVDYFSFSLISYEGQQMIVKVFSDVHK